MGITLYGSSIPVPFHSDLKKAKLTLFDGSSDPALIFCLFITTSSFLWGWAIIHSCIHSFICWVWKYTLSSCYECNTVSCEHTRWKKSLYMGSPTPFIFLLGTQFNYTSEPPWTSVWGHATKRRWREWGGRVTTSQACPIKVPIHSLYSTLGAKFWRQWHHDIEGTQPLKTCMEQPAHQPHQSWAINSVLFL